jgi:hypothetical protein
VSLYNFSSLILTLSHSLSLSLSGYLDYEEDMALFFGTVYSAVDSSVVSRKIVITDTGGWEEVVVVCEREREREREG